MSVNTAMFKKVTVSTAGETLRPNPQSMDTTGTFSNLRAEHRIPFAAGAIVRPKSREAVFGKIRDVARNSIYLYTEYQPEAKEKADIEIVLTGTNSQLSIKAPAVVVRKDEQGVAFRFSPPLEWWPVFELFSTSLLPHH